jgi:predicted enzyme related to lactoylglutathione lyase
MSRVQLALNVDMAESISFYSKLFNTEPAKIKPGYANFAAALSGESERAAMDR